MEELRFIFNVIIFGGIALMVAIVVFIIVRSKKVTKDVNSFKNHPNVNILGNYLFQNGMRPGKIIFTTNNEIFFGPFPNGYAQVPPQMVPPMDYNTRRGVAGALANQYGYGWTQYNVQANTGNPYIDQNADAYLFVTNAAQGQWIQ